LLHSISILCARECLATAGLYQLFIEQARFGPLSRTLLF
jgi:hypothetical protein